MEGRKPFKITHDDGVFFVSKNTCVTAEEEKEIIKILESYGLKPSKVELKAKLTTFIIGSLVFYLAKRYALDPLFDEIDGKIKNLLRNRKKRPK